VQAPSPIVITPGDQGGLLINGATNSSVMNLGDLDVWSFYGTPGDSNALRVVAQDFTPWIRLYGPDGTFIQEVRINNSNIREATMSQVITNAGTYTVVVSAAFANQSGPYTFKQSRVPPDLNVPDTQAIDEGATLQVSVSAQDPDVPAKPLVFALMSGPPGLTLTTAGPTNATINWVTAEADGPSTNSVVLTVTDTVNGKAYIRTNSFTVIVHEINTAPQLSVPPNQTLDELTPLNISASAQDADLPLNPLTFSISGAPSGMTIDPKTGAIAWIPNEEQGPSTNVIQVVVTDSSPSAINATSLSTTNSFTVVVREVNTPPQLTVPQNQTVDELTPLTFSAIGQDADLPANPLTFALSAAPPGMTINSASGLISWTPTEAQGPSTNVITVTLQDNGVPPLSATASFTIFVKEVNSAPVLPVQTDRVIDELTTLIVTNTATDTDLPANVLTYRLVSGPTNATLTADGIISWTPTEAQGPSTNVFTTIVTDDGSPSLGATNSFTVIVREVNLAPTLQSIAAQSLHFGAPLNLQAVGADSDLPANTLTYSIDQLPPGMTINPGTGAIAWTPAESDVGTHSITVKVTDNGSPSLSASTTFQVTVSGEGSSVEIQLLAGNLVQLTLTGDIGFDYEVQKSKDLVTWEKLVQLHLSTSPFPYIDPDSKTDTVRFYRLKLLQNP
jgi:hypothetical protein